MKRTMNGEHIYPDETPVVRIGEATNHDFTERELDVLLSTGEQVSMAKLAILLNRLNMPAISLTGWQAGIYTNNKVYLQKSYS